MVKYLTSGNLEEYEVLQIFPFTSESKRMGIVVKVTVTNLPRPTNLALKKSLWKAYFVYNTLNRIYIFLFPVYQ